MAKATALAALEWACWPDPELNEERRDIFRRDRAIDAQGNSAAFPCCRQHWHTGVYAWQQGGVCGLSVGAMKKARAGSVVGGLPGRHKDPLELLDSKELLQALRRYSCCHDVTLVVDADGRDTVTR